MSDDSNTAPDFKSPATRDDLKWSGIRRENDRLARELAAANAKVIEQKAELDKLWATQDTLSTILRATADALKGEPDPRMLHSWHDLPNWGAKARAVAMSYLAATAPGARDDARDDARMAFVQAIQDWRDLFGRDLFETALAFAELDKEGPNP